MGWLKHQPNNLDSRYFIVTVDTLEPPLLDLQVTEAGLNATGAVSPLLAIWKAPVASTIPG
jgi:hypothetical protein